jgi:hypothetical protein
MAFLQHKRRALEFHENTVSSITGHARTGRRRRRKTSQHQEMTAIKRNV